jgi:hypothetical protein
MSRLIVIAAFKRDGDSGELVPAFEPREMPSEERAKQDAALLSHSHAGVIAWYREAAPDVGDYGPPVVLARFGEIPDME